MGLRAAEVATRKARSPRAGTRKRKAHRKALTPGKTRRGLDAADIVLALDDESIAPLAVQVRERGGAPIGAYREPLSGSPVLVASLPLGSVQPTPFQRDLSPTHTKRLAQKIDEAGSFLDPIIVVRGEDGAWCTPNGRHRLAAAKVLGLKQITALVSPDEGLAFRILALNTEKAHNLKDRSLEVIRMARALARRAPRAKESDYAAQFEAPELLTLGVLYAKDSRFAGGAYGLPQEGGSLQRPHAARQPARARGLRRAAARDRCAGAQDRQVTRSARLEVSAPAHVRRGAHQSRALPSRQSGRHEAADADGGGSHAHDGRREAVRRR
jgi:ParB family chromosome partitioning protein